MEQSVLYDLLEEIFLRAWQKQTLEKDPYRYAQRERELTETLTSECSDRGKHLIASLCSAIEDKLDLVYHNSSVKLLHYAIKLGMDLQRAFSEMGQ